MKANILEKYWPTKSIWLAFCVVIGLLMGTSPAQAQTATPFVTTVTVTVLDENGDPVAFLPIELHMFEYTESIEAIAVGGCGTDENGRCSIEVIDPPHLGGWMEGMIYIPGLGMEYLGWSENLKMVVIQLLPGNVMVTPETFLHFPIEGQDETGTDVPLEMAPTAEADGATLTLALTATATQTPLPPTATATQTPENSPTVTTALTETPTATPTPAAIFGGEGSGQILLFVLAALGLLLLGLVVFWFWWQSQRAKTEPQEAATKESQNTNPEGDA